MPGGSWGKGIAAIGAALAILSITKAGSTHADDYHTPLAGAEYRTEVAGRPVVVPARDRDYVRSLDLGAAFFIPDVGGDWGAPFGAFYWLKNKDSWRSRAVISIFVNEIDVAREFGKFQLLGNWDNNTIPFATDEIIDEPGNKVQFHHLRRFQRRRRRGMPNPGGAVPFRQCTRIRLYL